jgi:hypothetical protein
MDATVTVQGVASVDLDAADDEVTVYGAEGGGNGARRALNVDALGKLVVRDEYQGGEVLADQTGAAGVLTFTFTSAVQLAVVDANGVATDIARADPFGGTPTATLGIPCRDETPTFMPVATSTVKVFAPSAMVVSVYGYRRA